MNNLVKTKCELAKQAAEEFVKEHPDHPYIDAMDVFTDHLLKSVIDHAILICDAVAEANKLEHNDKVAVGAELCSRAIKRGFGVE